MYWRGSRLQTIFQYSLAQTPKRSKINAPPQKLIETFYPKKDEMIRFYVDDDIKKISTDLVQHIEKEVENYETYLRQENNFLKTRELQMTISEGVVKISKTSKTSDKMHQTLQFQIPKDMLDLTRVKMVFQMEEGEDQLKNVLQLEIKAHSDGNYLIQRFNSQHFDLNMSEDNLLIIYESLDTFGLDTDMIKFAFSVIERHYAILYRTSFKKLQSFFLSGLSQQDLDAERKAPTIFTVQEFLDQKVDIMKGFVNVGEEDPTNPDSTPSSSSSHS